MSGHRVTIETAGTLTGAAAHSALCLCGWHVPLTIPRRRSCSGRLAHGEHRSPGGVGVFACPHNSQHFLVGGASLAGAGRVQARAAARRSEAESLDAARAG